MRPGFGQGGQVDVEHSHVDEDRHDENSEPPGQRVVHELSHRQARIAQNLVPETATNQHDAQQVRIDPDVLNAERTGQ